MQQTATEQQQPKTKRQRSPVERGLVWGAILALYLVVVFEWRAQYGYNQALGAVTAAMEAGEKSENPIELEDAVRAMKKKPSEEQQGKYGIAKVWIYTWRWRSLFKSYSIKLTVDQQDDSVLFLDTDT